MFQGGGKGVKGWQPYRLHVPIVLKSGSLNLMAPSGPVQALPFTLYFLMQFLSSCVVA